MYDVYNPSWLYISQSLVALRSCIEMGEFDGGTSNLSPEVRRSKQPFGI
jgi:hypothetical protein